MFIISLNDLTGNACGLSFQNGRAETDDALLAARMKLRGYAVEACGEVTEKPPCSANDTGINSDNTESGAGISRKSRAGKPAT